MTEPDYTSDLWLDARLRNVPVPVNLLKRLEQIGDTENDEMDRALRAVPLPVGLLERLRLISRLPQRQFAWRELAMAASVLLAVGLGYAGYVGIFLKSTYPEVAQPSAPATNNEVGEEPPASVGATVASQSFDPNARPDEFAPDGDSELVANQFDNGLGRSPDTVSPDAMSEDPATAEFADIGNSPSMPDLTTIPPAKFPAADQPPVWFPDKSHLLAEGGRFEPLPDLDAVELNVPRGLMPPHVPGYDLLFQLKNGEHPFVSPAANKQLQSVQVPLVTSSAGYRRAWRSLAERRSPAADDVRTEEFLAAIDFGFKPAAAGTVEVRTAGGPAPLRDPGLSLLQVVVQAGALPQEDRNATHLTIVLDTSAGMRRPDRWAAVQKALTRLREQMSPADRITLVSYDDDARVIVDSATRDEARILDSALKSMAPRRTANLAAGLTLACTALSHATLSPSVEAVPTTDAAVGAEAAAKVDRRLVVISSGRVDSDREAAKRTQIQVAELIKTGMPLQVLDFGRDELLASGLARWTEAAQGRFTRMTDPSALYWNLLEALVGRSPVVAERATLKVTFNSDVVDSYRLVGHERKTISGPSRSQTELDLRAGESVCGLFEVWLKPNVNAHVATVEVTWRKPGYGQAQVNKQVVSRSQFALTFVGSAPELQAAAIVALTAETLRGSCFAPTASHVLAPISEQARKVSPEVQNQPSFREFTDFIRQADWIRMHGRAAGPRGGATNVHP